MIDRSILLMHRRFRVRWSQMACWTGQQASAMITKKVRLLLLHVRLHQTLHNLQVIHGNGEVRVVL